MPKPTSTPLPRIVLLPGLDGSGAFYADLAAALPADAPPLILDYPQDRPRSYDALAADLLPRLPQNGGYVVIAESFGGPLAILLANLAEHKPRGMILAASFASSPIPLPSWVVMPLLGQTLKSAPPMPLVESVLLRPDDHALAFKIIKSIEKLDNEILMSRIKSAIKVDVRKALKALTLPILYLQGSKDRLVPPTAGLLMQKTARDLRLVRVDAPHFVLQYDAALMVELHILPFLRGLT